MTKYQREELEDFEYYGSHDTGNAEMAMIILVVFSLFASLGVLAVVISGLITKLG